jgi:hypothetical protein
MVSVGKKRREIERIRLKKTKMVSQNDVRRCFASRSHFMAAVSNKLAQHARRLAPLPAREKKPILVILR